MSGRPKAGVTFWDRVNSQIQEDGECLLFTGCKDSCGYGRINRDGKLVRLHRAVWERENGPIPSGMVVCHKCDRPACIAPDHLFIGTQKDNIRDMWAKGRGPLLQGSAQPGAKLNEEKVRTIRALIAEGVSCYEIGRRYGVIGETILHIKHRRNWTHA